MDAHIQQTILVLDDDPSLRQLMIDILSGEGGYRVTGVADAAGCLEAIRTTSFDLVLSDLTLMGLDDTGFQEQLQSDILARNMRVAFVSGVAQTTLEQRGIKDYLQKPFDVDDLLLFVARLLREDDNYAGAPCEQLSDS